MTPDRWQQLERIFSEALEREGVERDLFLKAACEGDPELYLEARRLLAGHERAAGFLSDPAIALSGGDEPPPLFAPEQVIAGRFRIVRFIARGGMGEVYEAEDLTLATKVALKTIQPRITGDTALELFKQEILSARRVTHPNVCRIYDIAEHGHPAVMFLSMELLEGPTLSRHLKEHGPFPRSKALPLISQICAGLQAAHDAGVIHRDFKSGNVILAGGSRVWRPVITDFGLALPAGSDVEKSPSAGTPGYMAPEQLQGGPATPATDVYALGVVIGRIIGATQFAGPGGSSSPSREPLRAGGEWKELGPWTGVVRRCLKEEPAQRYQRPAEVAAALWRSSKLLSPRRMALAIAALGGLFTLFWLTHRPPPAVPREIVNRRVWTGPDVDRSGSVSPDGHLLSFTDWKTGDLLVHDFETGENRRLTRNTGYLPPEFQYAGSSMFSHDGQWLAYTWQPPGEGMPMEVRAIGRDGSAQRTIYREADRSWLSIEDWTKDRRYLLVSSQRASGTKLLLVSGADGSSRAIPVSETSFGGGARLSRDGQYAAYKAQQAGDRPDSEIRVISLFTGADAPLLAHPGDESVLGWSLDGSRLIFRSMRSGASEIWDVPVVNGRAQGAPERLRSNADSFSTSLGITREGSLFYAIDRGASDVFVAELDQPSGKLSPPRVLSERFVGTKTSPAWSPDGSTVIYVAKNMLSLYDGQTGTERDVQPSLSRLVRVLEWSLDGRSVFVQGFGRDGMGGTFRVNLETGKSTIVLPGIVDREAFSRDARTIYMWGGPDQPKRIVSRTLLTGEEKPLYTRQVEFEIQNPNLSLSPDGKILALQLQNVPLGYNSLALMPATGGEPKTILAIRQPERFGANSFAWSPDMRYIFAARLLNNHSEIWRKIGRASCRERV